MLQGEFQAVGCEAVLLVRKYVKKDRGSEGGGRERLELLPQYLRILEQFVLEGRGVSEVGELTPVEIRKLDKNLLFLRQMKMRVFERVHMYKLGAGAVAGCRKGVRYSLTYGGNMGIVTGNVYRKSCKIPYYR